MMSVGLHCRIAGTPARSRAFIDFLEYVERFPGVWFAAAWTSPAGGSSTSSPAREA